jgi:hypothetical protein
MVGRTLWRDGAAVSAPLSALAVQAVRALPVFTMLAAATFACGPSESSGSSGGVAYSSGSGSSSSGGASSGQPLLVVVDTGQTLTASPGQGVGVFTEYQAGGHWRVWWTCDTGVTNLPCSFRIDITPGTGMAGSFANVDLPASTDPATLLSPSSSAITVTSTTKMDLDSVTFDTAPGATITLDAQINGAENGALLFFVQDGKVNGDYQGTISDPLMLEPSSP